MPNNKLSVFGYLHVVNLEMNWVIRGSKMPPKIRELQKLIQAVLAKTLIMLGNSTTRQDYK